MLVLYLNMSNPPMNHIAKYRTSVIFKMAIRQMIHADFAKYALRLLK